MSKPNEVIVSNIIYTSLWIAFVCAIFSFDSQIVYGQSGPAKFPEKPKKLITSAGSQFDQFELCFARGNYYLDKPGSFKNDLDSSSFFMDKAESLSKALKDTGLMIKTLLVQGDLNLQKKLLAKSDAYFKAVVNIYMRRGNRREAARTWDRYGDCFTRDSHYIPLKIICYGKSVEAYKSVPDPLAAIDEQKKIGDMHLIAGNYDLAEKEVLNVLQQYKALNYHNLHYTYDLLASINSRKGNLHQELSYKLLAVESMERNNDFKEADYLYSNLASCYRDIGLNEKSLYFYKKAMTFSLREKNLDWFYFNLKEIVSIYNKLNRTQEGLLFLKKRIQIYAPSTNLQKQWMYSALGDCYEHLGDLQTAENNLLKMVDFARKDNQNGYLNDYYNSYDMISKFYVRHKKFSKAKPYLATLLKAAQGLKAVPLLDVYLICFKVDSATGNLNSAIRYYQRYHRLHDSLFNAEEKKMVEVVQLRNESEKKDMTLRLQAKDIQLLKKQGQLERDRLGKSQLTRNVFIGGILVLLLLVGLLYNGYRQKQRNNRQLLNSQNSLSKKNDDLRRSLQENEWLLREVHHRVKNNMQMVTSLLVSQTDFLEDPAAINAITESRHRIQAMALIHQKIYKNKNVANIYLPEYVGELISYLKESFRECESILFQVEIAPIDLDVQQAVPIGLILNEAITNSIKHAFPNSNDDLIKISLTVNKINEVELTIADNGRGLPPDFSTNEHKTSFGLLLIKGFIEDLGGTFEMKSQTGTSLSIAFKINTRNGENSA
ncbi:MAG: hypothetical protein JWQ66_565 [Mucilaginibacter sp.]|nr:hypothetical protein [Mucilaginibacter sp.]